MIYRFFKLFAILIFLFSCKNTETYEDITSDEIILSFEKVKKTSITRDINYLPRWQDRIEFEGSYYIPLNTDKQIYSFTADSVKYSLIDRIWLKVNKQGELWNFTKLTVLPNDIKDSKGAGLFIYEDWQTGELSYDGYIEKRLLRAVSYEQEIRRMSGKIDKKAQLSPVGVYCRVVTSEICAGSGRGEVCTTRNETVCTSTTLPGGGNGGNTNPPPVGSGGHGGGSGGGNNTPPIVVDDIPSEEDKEIIDSLQGYPCAQEVLAKIPNLDNKISTWLSNEFGKNVDIKLFFRASTSLAKNLDGIWYANSKNLQAQTITLNGNMLTTASKEYIAATIFHEAYHSYLARELKKLEDEGRADQFGILFPGVTPVTFGLEAKFVKDHSEFGNFLSELKEAIKSFNPNISDTDAIALAKAGVVSNPTELQKQINLNYRSGANGTKCP